MARKHNCRHARSASRYPDRLQARGMSSASVRMPDLETLRRRQFRRDDAAHATLAAARDAATGDGEVR